MIRVLITDDHPIVREGLKKILSRESDIQVAGEAQNSEELMKLVQKEKWDIVVLDITMPGRGGLDVLKELSEKYPDLPVLILSMHPEDQFARRALQAGAAGYLTKDAAQEELITAVRKILSGEKYISARLAEKLAASLRISADKPPHETLSDRES
ncbi:MAG: response regulator transcription factor [Pseudomonadota bacterium]